MEVVRYCFCFCFHLCFNTFLVPSCNTFLFSHLCHLIVFFFSNHLLYSKVLSLEYLPEGCFTMDLVWVRIWFRLG